MVHSFPFIAAAFNEHLDAQKVLQKLLFNYFSYMIFVSVTNNIWIKVRNVVIKLRVGKV